ncbi:MAG TPA: hypothetical protein VMW23_04310, partial [Sedimentisphaerales bacterium]|nr:hypothetical protein [Sedimentisphaerales bacterium]
IMPLDGSDPADNYRTIRNELKQYSKALAKKSEVVVANKMDLNPPAGVIDLLKRRLRKPVYPISAVTGAGIKDLAELLWQNVKETKKSQKHF